MGGHSRPVKHKKHKMQPAITDCRSRVAGAENSHEVAELVKRRFLEESHSQRAATVGRAIARSAIPCPGYERRSRFRPMSDELASTPEPPYTAVIFRSIRTDDTDGYAVTASSMEQLAAEQPGYLGIETSTDRRTAITVSYWQTPDHARAWKAISRHAAAQRQGIDRWYADYSVRIATVEREYRHPHPVEPQEHH